MNSETKEIFVFKTNVKTKKLAKKAVVKLQIEFPNMDCNFDLEDKDNIFRLVVNNNLKNSIVKELNKMNVELTELE